MGLLNISDKQSFEEIENNEELNTFFSKIITYYNTFYHEEQTEMNKKIEEATPSFEQFDLLVENLQKTGIVIDKIEECKKMIKNGNYIIRCIFLTPLGVLSFNGVKLLKTDIEYIMNHANTLEKKIDYLESPYNHLKRENKNIEKKIAKLEKVEFYSHNSIADQMEHDKRLTRLKDALKFMKTEEEKINFIKNQTLPQRMLLAELFEVTRNLFYLYIAFESERKRIIIESTSKESNFPKRAYEEMINNSLAVIDIDDIVKKLFKILLKSELRELKEEYVASEETEDEEETEISKVNRKIINWFIDENRDKIVELFKNVFDDVDEISETLNEKVLKK